MNPFKPTAGKMPPVLIGRQAIIDVFSEGLENGAGAPGRLMLIMGQRGYGKTVMLTELSRVAVKEGWVVISDTATEGLCDRLIDALAPQKTHVQNTTIDPSISLAGLASIRVGRVDLSSSSTSLDLRNAIEKRLKKLPKGKGIVFTIDETQAASNEELESIATAVQHIIRDQDMSDLDDSEKKGIALVFASLPSIMDEVLNDKVLTFLRRSLHMQLRDIPAIDIRDAYVETVTASGKAISEDIALAAARISGGYPYMIQLMGYYMWQAAERRSSDVIEPEDVERAQSDSLIAFGDAVCAPVFSSLTDAQRGFVLHMAESVDEEVSLQEIAEKAQKSSSWASKYRASLIDDRVIEPAGRGKVQFAIPHFREYLQRRVER